MTKDFFNDKTYDEKETKLLENISNTLSVDFKIAKLLYSNGIDSVKKADRFINGDKKYFSDPYKIDGVEAGVKRIKRAIENSESVIIYGDYDADGICSVAILYLHLKKMGLNVNWYIPDREEGYGINIEAIEKIAEEYFPDLLITCDCGIMAAEEIEYINSIGIDVIVTDHHEPLDKKPDCTIINPKLGCDSDLKNLCGAGVALKLVQALSGIDGAMEYLDIAAIATIADSVPLLGENRDIVIEGLKLFNTCARPGICALAKTFNLKEEYNSATLAFMIAPRINAAGRIGAAERAIILFTETDEAILKATANDLHMANCERQEICENVLNGILNSKEFKNQINNPILIIYGETIPTGVLGIVASKLAERFYRPTFICTKADDLIKGSGRSIVEINLFEMLASMQDLFVKFGGHNQAAGITLEKECFEKFIESANSYLRNFNYGYMREEYDLCIAPKDLTLKFAKDLCVLEPFGAGNKRPRFLLENRLCEVVPMKNYLNHLIIKAGDINITAFNYSDKSDLLTAGIKKYFIIDISVNCYNNKESIKCTLKNILFDTENVSNIEEIVFARYLDSYNRRPNKPIYEYIDGYKTFLNGNNYGTLFLTNNIDCFLKFNLDIEKNIFNVSNKNNNNKIILSPNLDIDFSLFNKIVLLEKPNDSFIAELNCATNGKIYIIDRPVNTEQLKNIDFSRELFGKYYKLITENLGNLIYINDIAYIFNYFKKIDNTINMLQFCVCFNTFKDLKLLTTNTESGRININTIKVNLEESNFLGKIKELVL